MKKNFEKSFAISLLGVFLAVFAINPAYAIVDKTEKAQAKAQKAQQSVLDKINYDWWKELNDPYLEDYILKAAQNNHDIKTAALRIEQAQINVMATRSNQLPILSIGAAPAMAKFPASTKTQGSIALPVIAQYELDLFGKNWDKTKSSKKLLKGVEYQAAAADIAIVSLVASTYYNIVKLDKILELQEKIVSDRAQIYDLMKSSNNEGIASTADLIMSEKSYVLSQNDLIDYQKARQNALNALAVLIGDSPNNINEYKRAKFEDLPSNFKIPEEISSEIITNRPDYKSLEHQLEAAGIDVRVAKKEFLPTIDIFGLLTFLATSSASQMNWDSSLALLAGSVNLPLFTGFKKTANLKLNKNKYMQLLEEYQKTNLTAIQEVNDALYNFKSDSTKLQNNIKAFDIQKREFGFAQNKFDEGVISKLDLLQQREALLYTQQLTAISKMDCYLDKIGLYKTTGAQI